MLCTMVKELNVLMKESPPNCMFPESPYSVESTKKLPHYIYSDKQNTPPFLEGIWHLYPFRILGYLTNMHLAALRSSLSHCYFEVQTKLMALVSHPSTWISDKYAFHLGSSLSHCYFKMQTKYVHPNTLE